MKLSFGRLMAHIAGGAVGGLFGFYLPLFVVLSRERGHEMEAAIASSPVFGDIDILLLLMIFSALLCAGAGCWLLPRWIYPRRWGLLLTPEDTPKT